MSKPQVCRVRTGPERHVDQVLQGECPDVSAAAGKYQLGGRRVGGAACRRRPRGSDCERPARVHCRGIRLRHDRPLLRGGREIFRGQKDHRCGHQRRQAEVREGSI